MTDKIREEFEAEFSKVSNRHLDKYKTQNDNEKYVDNFVEAVFIGWRLSRESMKAIKYPDELIPDYKDDDYGSHDRAFCDGYNQALKDVESLNM